MLPFPKGTPLALECERIHKFSQNMVIAATSDELSQELAELTDVTTLRQLVKDHPEVASLLRAVMLIHEERGVSC
jgi:hypothetical protein